MSSILKALRKLEEEKAALGESRVDLARDILKRTAPRREKSSAKGLKMIFFVVLLGALAASAWLLLRPAPPVAVVETVAPPAVSRQSAIQSPAERSTQLRQPKPVSVRSEPLIQQPVPEKVIEVRPESALAPEEKLTQPLPERFEVAQQKRLSTPDPETELPAVAPVSPPPASEPVRTEPTAIQQQAGVIPAPLEKIPATVEFREEVLPNEQPVSVVAEPIFEAVTEPATEQFPQLTINAIVFKPLRGERLAVINDLPVMEGTSIKGAQIIEILPDGVRLSWRGTEFILPLAD